MSLNENRTAECSCARVTVDLGIEVTPGSRFPLPTLEMITPVELHGKIMADRRCRRWPLLGIAHLSSTLWAESAAYIITSMTECFDEIRPSEVGHVLNLATTNRQFKATRTPRIFRVFIDSCSMFHLADDPPAKQRHPHSRFI